MICITDVKLRASTVTLVQSGLEEEYDGKWRSGLEPVKLKVEDVMDKMQLFYEVVKSVVEKRLKKFEVEELQSLILTSDDFLAEGHGSIEICEPPTEAQSRIVKSLVKVIFHQLAGNNSPDAISEAHANLIFSLFITRITCDIYVESLAINKYTSSQFCNLQDSIKNILCNAATDTSEVACERPLFAGVQKFVANLFCCLEDLRNSNENRLLVDDFDKIDLYNEDGDKNEELDEENTLVSSRMPNALGSSVQISKQTLSFTKVTLLPSNELENLWESLYFDDGIKQKMYSYATIALKMASLSNQTVDHDETSTIFSNNKLLIVYGPPGTGKTTICKALVQKLSIRKEFSSNSNPIDANHKAILIEISCSRVFSRWFGESSKNLSNIFADVENLLKADEKANSFICLLIDEVEAIAFSRNDLLSKSESTDSVRVVSTLLTQLDRLKKYNNLLVLATSNLLDSLDPAFLDRADGVFYIGNPSEIGISEILTSSLKELIRKNIISCRNNERNALACQKYKEAIGLLSSKCMTLDISGRTLRKLPLVCLSEHFQVLPIPLDEFLIALALSISKMT